MEEEKKEEVVDPVAAAAASAVAVAEGAADINNNEQRDALLIPYTTHILGKARRGICPICYRPFEMIDKVVPLYCDACGRPNCGQPECVHDVEDHRTRGQCHAMGFANVRDYVYQLFAAPIDYPAEAEKRRAAEERGEKVEPLLMEALFIAMGISRAARRLPWGSERDIHARVHALRHRDGFQQLMMHPIALRDKADRVIPPIHPAPEVPIMDYQKKGLLAKESEGGPTVEEVWENEEEAARQAEAKALAAEKAKPKTWCLMDLVIQVRARARLDALCDETSLLDLFAAQLIEAHRGGEILAQLYHALNTYYTRLQLVWMTVAGMLTDKPDKETKGGQEGKYLFTSDELEENQLPYLYLRVGIDHVKNVYLAEWLMPDFKDGRFPSLQREFLTEFESDYAPSQGVEPVNVLFHLTFLHLSKTEGEATMGYGAFGSNKKKKAAPKPSGPKTWPWCVECKDMSKPAKYCTGCYTVKYCSKECQLAHRIRHRNACKVLKEEYAAKGIDARKKAYEEDAMPEPSEEEEEEEEEEGAGTPRPSRPRPASFQLLVRLYGDPKNPRLFVLTSHSDLYSLERWMSGRLITEQQTSAADHKWLNQHYPDGNNKAFHLLRGDVRLKDCPNVDGVMAAIQERYLVPAPRFARADLEGLSEIYALTQLMDCLCNEGATTKERLKAYQELTGVRWPKSSPLQRFSVLGMRGRFTA